MEPWLDSLSEDWKSEHQSSSPAPSLASSRRQSSILLSQSQSRIPHLARNIRKESSSSGSFLRHRSTRGKAATNAEPILKERSASSLNLPPPLSSYKQSSLPRRPSSAFSESQNSVQHYSVREKQIDAETPEWKRRLVQGEDLTSDGFDLFSPSKLEGVFKQPTPSQPQSDIDLDPTEGESRSWKPFTLPSTNDFPQQFSSYRPSRNRPTDLEVLEEVSENEDAGNHSLSAVSSDLIRTGSLRGIVRQRVQKLEQSQGASSGQSSPRPSTGHSDLDAHNPQDSRWRTFSGREELKNEFISPVTVSKQNSIRATVLGASTDIDLHQLQSKLQDAQSQQYQRPTSSSSDKDISYGYIPPTIDDSRNEPLPDLTSQSLPDDLSMGTQDFMSNGGFINSRRGGRSNEASFLRKELSSSKEDSHVSSLARPSITIRSSPPQYSNFADHNAEQSRLSASEPTTPQDTSVIHHVEDQLRPESSRSPLKLFGNRDTYTNNKLMRILSHFEEDEKEEKKKSIGLKTQLREDTDLRMSQFGMGDLDGFGFEKDVPRPSPQEIKSLTAEDRIFKKEASAAGPQQLGSIDTGTTPQDFASGTVVKQDVMAFENDRTTKRRKTLLKDQVTVEELQVEVKISQMEEPYTLAGTKRKDARPGSDGTTADPEILASRSLLRPRSHRLRSGSGTHSNPDESLMEIDGQTPEGDLTEALAAELASFAQEAADVKLDSRKPSLATKDYMEEANKVMQFIRSRGKPKPAVTETAQHMNTSELDADAILDLELDMDSTKDSFSRPPSRERSSKPSPARRHARHDSRTASYLRKYQDEEDLDMLTNTSAFATLPPPSRTSVRQAQQHPPSDTEYQESDPPNMRISNPAETLRKRKHSTSTVDRTHDLDHEHQLQEHKSSDNLSQNTFPTTSSTSGPKGIITSGSVAIPDHVGFMTFDHEKKTWVKKMSVPQEIAISDRQVFDTVEDDPFDSIPDLSVDETRENAAQNLHTKPNSTQPKVLLRDETTESQRRTESINEQVSRTVNHPETNSDSENERDDVVRSSLRSKNSEHEAKLHDGLPSKPPAEIKKDYKQPRVVTIAFSSPVVSAINYTNITDEDLENLPREEDLPLDDSDLSEPDVPDVKIEPAKTSFSRTSVAAKKEAIRVPTFQPRTVSPIEEQDEEGTAMNLSLIPVQQSMVLTPAPQRAVIKHHKAGFRASSILCLTPLSDFSLHQVDGGREYDQSYVEDRQHPHALRQAHGSLALSVDDLVKAITDAVAEELYWEKLRRLRLAPANLASAHGLKDYCPSLEELAINGNQIEHVRGLPETLRHLDIHDNLLNDLTSWASLSNLQYLDVSGNQLETLDGFSSLVHLRRLKANDNNITNIDGILDLDGLLELEVRDNDLTVVDFEGAELTRLKRLDISHNQLTDARNLHCLPALEELDLSYNVIESWLPEKSNALRGLKKLNISNNMLESVHLANLETVKYLNLDNNRISQIVGLSGAFNLEFLSLREQGKDSNIVDYVLSTSNECRHIRLSSNSVIDGSFSLPKLPQHNLRELEIAACGISSFPEKFGAFFPNCRRLNANFNGLSDLTPLRGMIKLRHVLVAKNRIKRLRRTCILLSKLACLEQIDLRDNPLTIGFYSPISETDNNTKSSNEARYHLPLGSPKEDASWLKVLDEVTGLKRRTIELLLAENCKNLIQLDGMDICHAKLNEKDGTWNKLTGQGVLAVPLCPPPVAEKEGLVQDDNLSTRSSQNGERDMTNGDGDVFEN